MSRVMSSPHRSSSISTSGATARRGSPMVVDVEWMVGDNKKNLKPMNAKDSRRIEGAYQFGARTFVTKDLTWNWKQDEYEFDFEAMKQTNLTNRKVRFLERCVLSSPQFDGHLESEYHASGNIAPPSSPVVLTGHFEPPPVHMPEMGYRHSPTASNDTWELSEAPTESHVAAGGVLACEQSPSRPMKWRNDPYNKSGYVSLDDADSECSAPAPTGLNIPESWADDWDETLDSF